MQIELDQSHIRVKKAKIARVLLWRSTQVGINLLIALTGVGGLLLLLSVGSTGYFLLALAVVFINLQLWIHGDLSDLKGELPDDPTQPIKLHLALDARVLGRSQDLTTPVDIFKAVQGMWSQQFFLARYGLFDEMIELGLSTDQNKATEVWQEAIRLAKLNGLTYIDAGSITSALIRSINGADDMLAQMRLDYDDIAAGVAWQAHIRRVVESFRQKHYFGGLARDWTSGYTPMLNRLGLNVSNDVQANGLLQRDVNNHVRTVDQVVQTLSSGGRPNVVLVGEVGTGKTTTVRTLAQRLFIDPNVPENIKYHQVVALNAPTLLAQVNDHANLEAVLMRIIGEAAQAKNIILFLDEAHLFLQEGTGSIDLSSVILPILERAPVRLILAMDPNAWQTLSARNSALVGLLNYQVVQPADEQTTIRIMEDQVLLIEHKHQVTFSYQSLLEAYRLADRYVHDMAFPGKAIRLLEASVNHAQNGFVTEQSVQASIETTRGVKVQTASHDEKAVLLNLEDQIHKRMINQSRAVSVVSDALRRARAGVGNPNRPIGAFLFLGPTGVGKTELSKALAEVYFSGEDRIVRVDMNEYVQSSDTQRLLAPAVEQGTSLLAQIKKQPFSVVLFDEIEKAHPDVVNIFLQLLDEGVMRDMSNQEVSFRDAIVIATSNAGADRIREMIDEGHHLEEFEEQFTNELIDSNHFKPEFLNRFDEIVLFRPLTPEELLQVVDIIMKNINKTLARQKVSVSLTDPAKRWLVDHGYDARLGARPLRRVIQRSVENIVARKLLEEQFAAGSTLELDVTDLEQTKS